MKKHLCLIPASLMLGILMLGILMLGIPTLFSACAKLPAPEEDFDVISDYQDWADDTGYSSGSLTDEGAAGVYQDAFRTQPGEPGYDSGCIVIGDSRCCQLGIYALRAGLQLHATFAVWGGHYTDREPRIATEEFYAEVEACFKRQIEVCGKCVVFFFATVNDYDWEGNDNAENIEAALACAERIGRMSCEKDGQTKYPCLVVIGMEGGDEASHGWIPDGFNRYVDAYNGELKDALLGGEHSEALSSRGGYTYLPLRGMTGGVLDFIDDGLHYGDRTLRAIENYIKNHSAR